MQLNFKKLYAHARYHYCKPNYHKLSSLSVALSVSVFHSSALFICWRSFLRRCRKGLWYICLLRIGRSLCNHLGVGGGSKTHVCISPLCVFVSAAVHVFLHAQMHRLAWITPKLLPNCWHCVCGRFSLWHLERNTLVRIYFSFQRWQSFLFVFSNQIIEVFQGNSLFVRPVCDLCHREPSSHTQESINVPEELTISGANLFLHFSFKDVVTAFFKAQARLPHWQDPSGNNQVLSKLTAMW